ncbi:MAG: beta-ketoacyl synthase N-terminal-like domain-containing protein [Bacillota bacterium]
MDKVYKMLFENITSGKVDRKAGVDILKALKEEENHNTRDDMAIIGISAKFPGAENISEFWTNLRSGVNSITDFPENRRQDSDAFVPFTYMKNEDVKYCKGGYLKEVDKFDHRFFGISPKEASLMDPSQRIFLETAWNAIEDGGYGGKKLMGSRTGLYIGYSGWPMYGQFVSHVEPAAFDVSVTGNISAIISRRIPYLMDMSSPSMLIDTACSSSLVALHLACQGIRNGDCDQALVGAIRLLLMPIEGMISYGIESKDYNSKPFDDSADGTTLSEGVAAILIKPLRKAIKDRDNVYAVIKGTACNQDGGSVGLTAQSAAAQENVIVKAWEDSGINPETISYIEGFGACTKLGDTLEIEGIQRAFGRYTHRKQFCGIGSVKSNIGHLDSCSGLAGLIKSVLSLKHREIPPTLNFRNPNKSINFEQSPVYINDRLKKWDSDIAKKRCGISSFGFSGTNAHVVLEEAAEINVERNLTKKHFFIFVLSAKSKESLEELIKAYKDYVRNEKEVRLHDICYTSSTGRGHYNYRLALIAESEAEFTEKLEKLDAAEVINNREDNVYFGWHKAVPANKEFRQDGELTESEIREYGKAANLLIDKYKKDIYGEKSILAELCGLYVKGADLDWERLYEGDKYYRISLPVYPFERKRCWINVKKKPEEYIKPGTKTDKARLENVLDENIDFKF